MKPSIRNFVRALRHRLTTVAAAVIGFAGSIMSALSRPRANGLAFRAKLQGSAAKSPTREMRRQKRLLEAILDNLPHAVFWKDHNGVYRGCSPAFLRQRGFKSSEQVIGKTLDDLRGMVGEVDIAIGNDRSVLSTGIPTMNVEETMLGADGSLRNLLTSKVPLRDTDGEIMGILGISADITELKRVEQALRERERQLSTLMNNLPGMAYRCLTDSLWTTEFVSAGSYPLTGYRPEDLIGNTRISFAEIIHLEDRKGVEDAVQAAIQARQPFEIQYRVVTASGEVKWVWERGEAVYDDDGEPVAIEGFVTDVTRLKQAEQSVIKHAELLDTIIETIPYGIFWKNRDLVYEGGNTRAAHSWFFERREDLIGKRISDLTDSREEAEMLTAMDRQVIEEGRSLVNAEDIHVLADGSVATHMTSKVPLRDSDGNVTGLLCIFTDITDRKRREEEITASERRFRDLIEGSIQGIYIQRASKILFANQACAEIFGYSSPEDLLGLNSIEAIFHPEDWKNLKDYSARRLSGEELPTHYESRGIKADGSVLWVERQVRVVEWFGAPAVQVTLVDITDRKLAESALQERENLLRGITMSAQDAIVLVDDQNRIGFWNEAAVKIFGYVEAEVIGQSAHEILAPENYRADAWRGFEHFARTGQGQVIGSVVNLMARHKSGREFPVDLSVSPMKRDGRWHAVAVIRDVSERVAAEEQLRHAQKMKSLGFLAGGMAHELNNLLHPILVFTNMVVKKMPAGDKDRGKLEMVIAAAQKAATIIAQVMNFSRSEGGERSDIEIGTVIGDTLTLIASTIPSSITIRQEIDSNVGLISADPVQIQNVLMNVVSNAADAYGSKSGEIVVALDSIVIGPNAGSGAHDIKAGKYARLTVTDFGVGMDAETLEHVLDPFFTTKEVGEGTGLGMSMVHGIVERHKGKIHIDSALGKGTRIDIYLPTLAQNERSDVQGP